MLKVTSKTTKLSLIAVCALMLAAFTNCGPNTPGPDASGNEIAATVNGKEIKLGEVDSIISLQTSGRQGDMTDADLNDVATYIHSLPPTAHGPFSCHP